jgi:hypothetical protein
LQVERMLRSSMLRASPPARHGQPTAKPWRRSSYPTDWQTTLDALQRLDSVGDSLPVGYYGLSQGGEMGIRLVALHPYRAKPALPNVRPETSQGSSAWGYLSDLKLEPTEQGE